MQLVEVTVTRKIIELKVPFLLFQANLYFKRVLNVFVSVYTVIKII